MKWIKVSDSLPDEGVMVLTYKAYDDSFNVDYIMDIMDEKIWACTIHYDNYKTSHWCYLEKPKD